MATHQEIAGAIEAMDKIHQLSFEVRASIRNALHAAQPFPEAPPAAEDEFSFEQPPQRRGVAYPSLLPDYLRPRYEGHSISQAAPAKKAASAPEPPALVSDDLGIY